MSTNTRPQISRQATAPTAIAPEAMPEPVAATPQADEFNSPEFEEVHESLPYLQMLNAQALDQCGFFISQSNAEAVDFQPSEDWVPHTATFKSGESESGYRSLTARFLILRKSPLMMFDRESDELIGRFNKQYYAQHKRSIVLRTRHLVYLMGKNKQLLHDSPLQFTAKGSFGGSLGDALKTFHAEMNKAYGAATGARKPRGERFMALTILPVQVAPVLKGEGKDKSWVCSVAHCGMPTPNNWKAFFVGYSDLKERILTEFEQWEGFGNPDFEHHSSTAPHPEEFETDFEGEF